MNSKILGLVLVALLFIFLPTPLLAAEACVDVKNSAGQTLQNNTLLASGSTIFINGQAVGGVTLKPQADGTVVMESAGRCE